MTAKQFKAKRLKAGFKTQSDLAKHLMISLRTINAVENGKRPVSNLLKMAMNNLSPAPMGVM